MAATVGNPASWSSSGHAAGLELLVQDLHHRLLAQAELHAARERDEDLLVGLALSDLHHLLLR